MLFQQQRYNSHSKYLLIIILVYCCCHQTHSPYYKFLITSVSMAWYLSKLIIILSLSRKERKINFIYSKEHPKSYFERKGKWSEMSFICKTLKLTLNFIQNKYPYYRSIIVNLCKISFYKAMIGELQQVWGQSGFYCKFKKFWPMWQDTISQYKLTN